MSFFNQITINPQMEQKQIYRCAGFITCSTTRYIGRWISLMMTLSNLVITKMCIYKHWSVEDKHKNQNPSSCALNRSWLSSFV